MDGHRKKFSHGPDVCPKRNTGARWHRVCVLPIDGYFACSRPETRGGASKRTFQCLDCDGPDPIKTDKVTGWLKGELRPAK